MVHALREIWRVLKPGGFLIDLRPYTTPEYKRIVEIVTDTDIIHVGYVDSTVGMSDDVAANAAMQSVVDAGLYHLDKRASFEFRSYWDTPEALWQYLEKSRKSTLSRDVIDLAATLLEEHGASAKLITRRNLTIGRYTRLEQP